MARLELLLLLGLLLEARFMGFGCCICVVLNVLYVLSVVVVVAVVVVVVDCVSTAS